MGSNSELLKKALKLIWFLGISNCGFLISNLRS